MSFEITITNHPAVAPHPLDRTKKLKDKEGNPVPLFPDHFSIRLDGSIVGYLLPSNKISLIVPRQQLTEVVVAEIEKQVEQFSDRKAVHVNAVSEFIEEDEEYDD